MIIANILKHFQKNGKLNKFLDKLSFEYGNTIKLIYRVSEDKELSFEKFINTNINTDKSLLIIKTSLDIYFIKIYHHKYTIVDGVAKSIDDNYFIFDNENYLKLNEDEIILDVHFGNEHWKGTNRINKYIYNI